MKPGDRGGDPANGVKTRCARRDLFTRESMSNLDYYVAWRHARARARVDSRAVTRKAAAE